ncbi:hypothetical protein [Actinoplanes sp. NPDC051851]|uniref:hypothetical protein n=1 Tax=Actinoplanes sp. NPDC051851 TaxID=3154753 RepID=UPI003442DC97
MRPLVVYAGHTAHVLAVLARTGPEQLAPDSAEPLVGDALTLWAGGSDEAPGDPVPLPVPAGDLVPAVVEEQPGLLTVPLAFGVQVIGGEAGPDLRLLQPGDPDGGPLIPPAGNVTVTLAADRVVVTLPAPTTVALPVLLVVGGERTRPAVRDQIDQGASVKEFRMNLEPGTYGVLALVASWRGVIHRGVLS